MDRNSERNALHSLLRANPVVGLLGARQVGKTTLAREVAKRFAGPATLFDLEDPRDQARLQDPMLALQSLTGLVVLDEVQRLPALFETLRVLADRPGEPARFLVLGSASPDLLRQGSESLAGRIAFHELGGFALDETGPDRLETLWLRGGFPRSFLAADDGSSLDWRREFVRTFLERDLPGLGFRTAPATLRRFWTMLAHLHGQTLNASRLGRSLGVADTTVRHYLDVLGSALVVRQLQPWHENLGKRQVRAPKAYLVDSGLLHALLGIHGMEDLQGHPAAGASWEGLAIQQILRRLGARPEEAYFWRTHAGAELDLLVVRGRRRLGFEIKRTVAPKVTASMRTALADLGLERLDAIHAGSATFPLGPGIRALPLARILDDLEPL